MFGDLTSDVNGIKKGMCEMFMNGLKRRKKEEKQKKMKTKYEEIKQKQTKNGSTGEMQMGISCLFTNCFIPSVPPTF